MTSHSGYKVKLVMLWVPFSQRGNHGLEIEFGITDEHVLVLLLWDDCSLLGVLCGAPEHRKKKSKLSEVTRLLTCTKKH